MARVFPFLFDRRIIRGTCDRRCTDHGRCREHSRTPSFKWISHGRNLLSACFDRAPATYAFIHLAIKRGVELQWKCFREFSYLSRRRRRRRRVKKFIGNCSPSSMGKCWPIFFPSSFFFFHVHRRSMLVSLEFFPFTTFIYLFFKLSSCNIPFLWRQ